MNDDDAMLARLGDEVARDLAERYFELKAFDAALVFEAEEARKAVFHITPPDIEHAWDAVEFLTRYERR